VSDEAAYGEAEEERPRDVAIDAAIARVRTFFAQSPHRLFYSTQIETSLEREFFHWITGKALLELSAGTIQRIPEMVQGNVLNFYAHPSHRYFRRELATMKEILTRIFDPEFARAVGLHGELMFDAALGRHGFRAEARSANSWQGKVWTKTGHNLDRIVTRDQRAYGVEVKNTQGYISRGELRTKLDLSHHLGLTPLFIMRFAPKSYIHEIVRRGGFALLFEQQMYPFGHAALLAEVQDTLGLKVLSPQDVKDGDIQRFLKWHERKLRT
jgi:hypothetical protein